MAADISRVEAKRQGVELGPVPRRRRAEQAACLKAPRLRLRLRAAHGAAAVLCVGEGAELPSRVLRSRTSRCRRQTSRLQLSAAEMGITGCRVGSFNFSSSNNTEIPQAPPLQPKIGPKMVTGDWTVPICPHTQSAAECTASVYWCDNRNAG